MISEWILYILAGLIFTAGIVLIVRPNWRKEISQYLPYVLVSIGAFFLFWGKKKQAAKQPQVPKRTVEHTKKFDPQKGNKIDAKINEIENKVFIESIPPNASVDDHIDYLRKHYGERPSKK